MNNKIFYSFAICLLLVLTLSIVIAKKPVENNSTDIKQKNMTYGLCVANLTKVKNSCFKIAQQNYKTCEKDIRNLTKTLKENNQTVNKTEIKNMQINCRTNLKNQLNTCKENFKAGKVLCIQYKCNKNQQFLNNTCVKI